jgi:hypothetical protein
LSYLFSNPDTSNRLASILFQVKFEERRKERWMEIGKQRQEKNRKARRAGKQYVNQEGKIAILVYGINPSRCSEGKRGSMRRRGMERGEGREGVNSSLRWKCVNKINTMRWGREKDGKQRRERRAGRREREIRQLNEKRR